MSHRVSYITYTVSRQYDVIIILYIAIVITIRAGYYI